MSRVSIEIGAMPPAITDSARAVLAAHGIELRTACGRRLGDDEVGAVLRELGKNAAQAVVCVAAEDEP